MLWLIVVAGVVGASYDLDENHRSPSDFAHFMLT